MGSISISFVSYQSGFTVVLETYMPKFLSVVSHLSHKKVKYGEAPAL